METKETKETKETRPIGIPMDLDNYLRIEQRANADHLQIATWCRRVILMYLEGRLVEANGNGHKKEMCPSAVCD